MALGTDFLFGYLDSSGRVMGISMLRLKSGPGPLW